MADLFLIAHKVRGEPAFDIAERMTCPICQGGAECIECDFDGFWWIIPTSGHRAYPMESWPMTLMNITFPVGWPLESFPDHYPTRSAKPDKSSGKSLLAALGLVPKVVRRL